MGRGVGAGPNTGAPSTIENLELWHGHLISPAVTEPTRHPLWVQCASNARKSPAVGCVTTTLKGETTTPPPTGTSWERSSAPTVGSVGVGLAVLVGLGSLVVGSAVGLGSRVGSRLGWLLGWLLGALLGVGVRSGAAAPVAFSVGVREPAADGEWAGRVVTDADVAAAAAVDGSVGPDDPHPATRQVPHTASTPLRKPRR